MQADFAVEIGAEEDSLEVPWRAPDDSLRFLDLKRRPELLLDVAEARENRDLAGFLAHVNQPHTGLATAKCDVWSTGEMFEEEEHFGEALKYSSYVDLVFSQPERQLSFEAHEELARRMCALLCKVPEIPSAAEFILRRCYFHRHGAKQDSKNDGPSDDGYCICFYLSGYGADVAEARSRWAIGLKLVQNALTQLEAAARR